MGKGFQTIQFPLPTQTFAAGGRSVVRLRDLPAELFGRIAHLAGIHLTVDLDPTYTTAPTVVGHNALFSRIELFDGQQVRFTGNGNDLRMFERLENGGSRAMEALTNGGSTNNRYWSRYLSLGPPNMAGSPTDFVFPCAALENGELRINWGALTDISADTTAATATVYVTAVLVLLDEIRIPPFYERQTYSLAGADSPIPGRCLALFMGLCNSNAYDAFTAGDIDNVTVGTGLGDVVPSVDASALTHLFNQMWGRGSVDGIAGDPFNATYDVNNRIVNLGTPTALAAQALDQQPVLWMPKEGRITKCVAIVDSSLRVRWSGANGAGTIMHLGRLLEQPPAVIATIAERAARRLGVRGALKLKLLDGGSPGPFVPYLPHVYKRA